MSAEFAYGLQVGIVLGAALGLFLGLVVIPAVVDVWTHLLRRRDRDVR